MAPPSKLKKGRADRAPARTALKAEIRFQRRQAVLVLPVPRCTRFSRAPRSDRRCWPRRRPDGNSATHAEVSARVSEMLALLTAGVALAVAAGGAQDSPIPGSRFVCTALPPEAAGAGCPLPAMPMQGGTLSPEEELRAAVLQLRETVVQQKETLGTQREAIRELTGKLARCEGLAGGKARGSGATGKDTMGDLPRDPGHVVEQLSRSLQTLKDRLESLEVAAREGHLAGGGSRIVEQRVREKWVGTRAPIPARAEFGGASLAPALDLTRMASVLPVLCPLVGWER